MKPPHLKTQSAGRRGINWSSPCDANFLFGQHKYVITACVPVSRQQWDRALRCAQHVVRLFQDAAFPAAEDPEERGAVPALIKTPETAAENRETAAGVLNTLRVDVTRRFILPVFIQLNRD
ncbi:hypothetical protein NQZ68_034296 [Dissostichus eleginoides]|nr:hypothetical protein NQZ68_034296 [Dissostichus eleginoides]